MKTTRVVLGAPVTAANSTTAPSLKNSKKRICFWDLYQELQQKEFKEIYNHLTTPEIKKVYVEWGCAVIAEASVALGTGGMADCSALKLIDPTSGNLHYMLHAFKDATKPSEITKSLRKARSLGMNLKDSEIEIMPGNWLNSSSTPHILEALYKVNSSLIDKVSLIRGPGGLSLITHNLVTHDGETYCFPETLNQVFSHCSHIGTLSKDGYEQIMKR